MYGQNNQKNYQNSPEIPQRRLAGGLKKPYTCPMQTENNSNHSSLHQPKQQDETKLTGIEDKLVEIIENEIISRNPGVK